ncbi:MAG: hypothetical protein ACOYM3_17545 [Terrimicrobiaceae bacterium]
MTRNATSEAEIRPEMQGSRTGSIRSDAPEILSVAELKRRQSIAEDLAAEYVGGSLIDWGFDTSGLLSNCPGESSHTSKEGHRDTRVCIDGTPTLHCFHEHCRQVVGDFNKKLRDRILNDEGGDRTPAAALRAPGKKSEWPDLCAMIEKRVTAALPVIIGEHAWPIERILADSPVPVAGMEPEQQWREIVALPPDSDEMIWIGQKMESGSAAYADKFHSRQEWLSRNGAAPANFILPAMLRPGSVSRKKEDITRKTICVVESDDLKHDEIGAVFHWLEIELGWQLLAVVDTAGKSLHGWFKPPDLPPRELCALIKGLKCDANVLRDTQPVRLPGAMRDGRMQQLIYLRRI